MGYSANFECQLYYFHLIVTLFADAKEFDQNHKDDTDNKGKAEETASPLICLHWSVVKGLAEKTWFALKLDDSRKCKPIRSTIIVLFAFLHNVKFFHKTSSTHFQICPTQSLFSLMLPYQELLKCFTLSTNWRPLRFRHPMKSPIWTKIEWSNFMRLSFISSRWPHPRMGKWSQTKLLHQSGWLNY